MKNVDEILIEKVREHIAKYGNPYESFRGENWKVKEWKGEVCKK